jgi:hypothetical protein
LMLHVDEQRRTLVTLASRPGAARAAAAADLDATARCSRRSSSRCRRRDSRPEAAAALARPWQPSHAPPAPLARAGRPPDAHVQGCRWAELDLAGEAARRGGGNAVALAVGSKRTSVSE